MCRQWRRSGDDRRALAAPSTCFCAGARPRCSRFKAGKVVALGRREPARIARRAPTADDCRGGCPHFGRSPSWYAIVEPAGTPPAIVARCRRESPRRSHDPTAGRRSQALGASRSGTRRPVRSDAATEWRAAEDCARKPTSCRLRTAETVDPRRHLPHPVRRLVRNSNARRQALLPLLISSPHSRRLRGTGAAQPHAL